MVPTDDDPVGLSHDCEMDARFFTVRSLDRAWNAAESNPSLIRQTPDHPNSSSVTRRFRWTSLAYAGAFARLAASRSKATGA